MAKRPAPPAELFRRKSFEAFVEALPGTSIARQWGDASVGKLGGKIFATFNDGGGAAAATISFKCSDHSFELLTGLSGVKPAPYLARAKWVAVVAESPLTGKELAGYVEHAHRIVAGRLTRRQRAELGLDPAIAAAPDKPSARHRAD